MKRSLGIIFLGTLLLRNPFVYDDPAVAAAFVLTDATLADAVMHDFSDAPGARCKMIRCDGCIKIMRTKKSPST